MLSLLFITLFVRAEYDVSIQHVTNSTSCAVIVHDENKEYVRIVPGCKVEEKTEELKEWIKSLKIKYD